MENFTFKDRYTIADLVEIVAILRAPGGCPWDIEQTHESIRRDFIEETYEAIEAIDKGSREMLLEELGDVLMQVVFHAQIEKEKNSFDFDDVADGICKKLIVRHPHVFGDVKAETSAEVLKNWDAIKMDEKKQKSVTESILSVPRQFPALMRAEKIQKKAAKVGFDWPDVSGALDKIGEETEEVRAAIASGDEKKALDELGDLLFSVVNVCRFAHVDAEEALTHTSDKFTDRFSYVEQKAAESGTPMAELPLETLDGYWNEAKTRE
ncbi:MAG: nucleoside triphosphate pyrophosphohydrolase [Clostridia bacterium]|nr:nucleoside triphosphate pyrophosphohydrolase [Clostridia bacterium]